METINKYITSNWGPVSYTHLDVYKRQEQGPAPLYQALNQAYEQAEQVIPTRWQEYENASRDEYHLVRGNYYYLFTLAERIKKRCV